MLDKIQTKIDSLSIGKKLILGAGIRAEEVSSYIEFVRKLTNSRGYKDCECTALSNCY